MKFSKVFFLRVRPSSLVGAAALFAAALSSCALSAEPVRLKLSYIGPEQGIVYQAGIKPFVDAVNAEGDGLVQIVVYANGALGKSVAEQPALLQREIADIAWVVPGQTPYRFPDNQVFELPGIAHDAREGTLAYTRLVAAGALRGYGEYYVVGAYTTAPSYIHSRRAIWSLAALRGQKIRANNGTEAETLTRLGAIPTIMPVSQLAAAMERNTVDGSVVAFSGYFDFGSPSASPHHLLLPVGMAPVALLMKRKTFDGLPEPVKNLIRKHGGERAANIWIDAITGFNESSLASLRAKPEHTVVAPSPADTEAADRVFREVVESWAAEGEQNRVLLKKFEAELAVIRSAPRQ